MSNPHCDELEGIIRRQMAIFDVDPIYLHWITRLVEGAEREMSSCCGNACRPCTLTIDALVAAVRNIRRDPGGTCRAP